MQDYHIQKFHHLLEWIWQHAVLKDKRQAKGMKNRPDTASRRQAWCEQLSKDIVQHLGVGADRECLAGFFTSIEAITNQLRPHPLFPSGKVVGRDVYFWVIIWPQIELILQEVHKNTRYACGLRFLAATFAKHGLAPLGNAPIAARAVILGLREQLNALCAADAVDGAGQVTHPNFNTALNRMIKARSFPTEPTQDRALTVLKDELQGKVGDPQTICDQVKQILMCSKIVHSAGNSPISVDHAILCPASAQQAHQKIFIAFQPASVVREESIEAMTRPIIQAFEQQLNNIDPARFLTNTAVKIGSRRATRELFNHNGGQYHCYVLQEQIKSDLSEGRKSVRVRNSSLSLERMGTPVGLTRRYFASMAPSRFMLNAVFSSTMQLTSLSRTLELKERCEEILRMLAEHLQAGSDSATFVDKIAIAQINLIKDFLDHYNAHQHLGRIGFELCAFLYAFKYKFDPGFQPQSMGRLDLILHDCIDHSQLNEIVRYETPFGYRQRQLKWSGLGVSIKLIQLYNDFVIRHTTTPGLYLCNPLARLSERLDGALDFDASSLSVKALNREVNQAFGTHKQKSILRIGGVRPYEALRDVQFYLQALKLENAGDDLAGIRKYRALPIELQHSILKSLDKTAFATDVKPDDCY